jgi:glycosyltransferase involved in cell wall biosynthesis
MKVFEYMASGRAILSSDLSVLREVLSSENAVLLPPDDLEAWITAIRELQGDPQWRARLGDRARRDVQQYSWETRAQTILAGISIQSDSAAAPVHTVERYP